MLVFALRRIVMLVVVLFFMVVALFALRNVIPADPARALLGPDATTQAVDAMRGEMGLDRPLPLQFGDYLWGLLHLDLGTSTYDGRPVLQSLVAYAPASMELASVATVLSVGAGLLLGVFAATHRYTVGDTTARFGAIAGRAIPSFWLALLLQIVFYRMLGWFPDGARFDLLAGHEPARMTGLYLVDSLLRADWSALRDSAYHLVLPALAIAIGGIAEIQRMTTAMVVLELRRDYVRTARAKGVASRVVLFRHVIRNAINPVVTVIGVRFGYLLAGTVLVETIFRWPGIGRYALISIQNLDFPAIMGVTLFVAVVFAVVNLCVDILYGYLDPRVRYA